MGTVCSIPTFPATDPVSGGPYFNPDTTKNPTVASGGLLINSTSGYRWGDITMMAGTNCGQPTAPVWNDLQIQAGAAGTTTVVQTNSLVMQQCTRLVILGAGNIELRVGTTNNAVSVQQHARFGVASTDTFSTPAIVPAGQLTVKINSAASGALSVQQADYISGGFLVPNTTDLSRTAHW